MAGRDAGGASTSARDTGGFFSSSSSWSTWARQARQLVNRVVFQIDEEQEARMRAYLDETYGGADFETRRDRPVQMDALRRVSEPE